MNNYCCWCKNECLNKLWNVLKSLWTLLGYFANKPTDFLPQILPPSLPLPPCSLTHRLIPACIQFAYATVQKAWLLWSDTSKIRTAAPPDVLEAAAGILLHLYFPPWSSMCAHMQACKGSASWHFSSAGMVNYCRARLTPIKCKAAGSFAWNRESSGVQGEGRMREVQWRARSRHNGWRIWWKENVIHLFFFEVWELWGSGFGSFLSSCLSLLFACQES